LLHAGNVNIANLNVVRASRPQQGDDRQEQQQEQGQGQQAVTLMSLDNDIPLKIMNQIRGLSSLGDVAKIRLM
jgi:hypothetical protein